MLEEAQIPNEQSPPATVRQICRGIAPDGPGATFDKAMPWVEEREADNCRKASRAILHAARMANNRALSAGLGFTLAWTGGLSGADIRATRPPAHHSDPIKKSPSAVGPKRPKPASGVSVISPKYTSRSFTEYRSTLQKSMSRARPSATSNIRLSVAGF